MAELPDDSLASDSRSRPGPARPALAHKKNRTPKDAALFEHCLAQPGQQHHFTYCLRRVARAPSNKPVAVRSSVPGTGTSRTRSVDVVVESNSV